jgi:hypothetical protein
LNFSIEDLFPTKTVEPSETVTDAVQSYHIGTISTHGNNNKKRGLLLDKHDNMTERPIKRKCNVPTVPILNNEPGYKHSKKNRQDEKKWKEYGHLLRKLTKRKYMRSSQQWTTPLSIFNSTSKTGGYTAMPSKIKDMVKIQSVEHAISLGFNIIKYDSW